MDLCGFKASLFYIERSRLAMATEEDPVSIIKLFAKETGLIHFKGVTME